MNIAVTSQLDLLDAELETAEAEAIAVQEAFSQLLADINLSRITTADAKAKFKQLIVRRQSAVDRLAATSRALSGAKVGRASPTQTSRHPKVLKFPESRSGLNTRPESQ